MDLLNASEILTLDFYGKEDGHGVARARDYDTESMMILIAGGAAEAPLAILKLLI